MPDTLQQWIDEVCPALGLDAGALDRDLILDLARDVAHNVARPAAPLTAFLVGLAAGRHGGSVGDVRTATATTTELAMRFTRESGE